MSIASPDTPGSSASSADAADGEEIVARAGRYYRNARYLIAFMCVAAGGWFAYDGWVKYPEHNRKVDAGEIRETKHSDTDIRLQRILAMGLPPVGIFVLGWTLYRSRGVYRLAGDTLHVPGHPPIPLDDIQEMDMDKWDKKGIAYAKYQTASMTAPAEATLDDFIYERAPTDKIVERIRKHLDPGSGSSATENAEAAGEGDEASSDVDA